MLAGATLSLLLPLIIAVNLPGPASSIPDRIEGWGLASLLSLFAISVMWPAPARDPVRSSAIAACRALANRLRVEIAFVMAGRPSGGEAEYRDAVAASDAAVEAVQTGFFATPYRPTGLSTSARAVVRLVDELRWLNTIVLRSVLTTPRGQADPRGLRGQARRGRRARVRRRHAGGSRSRPARSTTPPRACARRWRPSSG